jgi:hypothetical protein
MAMSPPPHLVVISSIALVKRGSDRHDLRLPAQPWPLPRNDHFGAPVMRSAGASAGSCDPSQCPGASRLRPHQAGLGPGSIPSRAHSAHQYRLRSPPLYWRSPVIT